MPAVAGRGAVRILELKSTEHLPDTLYTSYECQLYGYFENPFGMTLLRGVALDA